VNARHGFFFILDDEQGEDVRMLAQGRVVEVVDWQRLILINGIIVTMSAALLAAVHFRERVAEVGAQKP